MDSSATGLIVVGVVAGVLAISLILPRFRSKPTPQEDVPPIFEARGVGSIAPVLGLSTIATNVSSYTLRFYEEWVVFASITRTRFSYNEIAWVKRGILNTIWICLANGRRFILFLPSDAVQIMDVFRKKGVQINGVRVNQRGQRH